MKGLVSTIDIRGQIRIIFEPNRIDKVLFVDRIDFRGDVYK